MAMAMAASLAAHHHLAGGGLLPTPRASGRNGRSGITISMRAQRKQSGDSGSGKGDGGDGRVSGRRRVWRRRKLTKEDDMLRYKLERVPFLEEKVRKVRENGKIICLDINQLMLSQENRFAFTIEVAEEANSYLEKNRHEYGLKKPILHVLSDRMNEAGTRKHKMGPLFRTEQSCRQFCCEDLGIPRITSMIKCRLSPDL
uniref:Uncharacterized protein n=1 Tax=Oryza glumipatula TaxID=40148 RepID=A0A0D9YDT4_9ORYZ